MRNEQDLTVVKTEEEWRQQLTPEQYYVIRQKGTERPFTGRLLMNKEKGVYRCAACGNELFTDEMKFDSHCGWPSFDREIAGGKIHTHEDNTHGMRRTEITCAQCGGHLGHIFDDGPTETGLRYCVNSVSIDFVPESAAAKSDGANIGTITLGAGCYWCVEAAFAQLDGVISAVSGFSGGHVVSPTYEEVCTGNTGHAEVVQVKYDKTKTSLEEILRVFFTVHDPTTLNRQGEDVGTQYRSAIYFHTPEQERVARETIAALNDAQVYANRIVTEVTPYDTFYSAPGYHQDYYNNNPNQPYCQLVVRPKLDKFEKVFKDRLKNNVQLS